MSGVSSQYDFFKKVNLDPNGNIGISIMGGTASGGTVDAASVDAAGAVMNTDITTASMSFVIDEDNMVSNLDTKVPTQQSVKAYVDNSVNATSVDAAGAVMNTDSTTTSMSFVIDEDNMVSNLATKVPTQQSVKAYVDNQIPILSKTFTLEAPTAADNITMFRTDADITIQEIVAVSTGTSPSTTYQIKSGVDRSLISNNVTTSNTTTSKLTGDIATLSSTLVTANSWVVFTSSAASGTNVVLTIDVRYTEN